MLGEKGFTQRRKQVRVGASLFSEFVHPITTMHRNYQPASMELWSDIQFVTPSLVFVDVYPVLR
jgi:hypothetical protein